MEPHENATLDCPFCNFSDTDHYFLTQHVELCHPENGVSPFIANESAPDPSENSKLRCGDDQPVPGRSSASGTPLENGYIECPHGCGESITQEELSTHLDLHIAEGMALEEAGMTTVQEDDSKEPLDSDDYYEDEIETRFSSALPKALRNRDELPQGKPSKRSHKSSSQSQRSSREPSRHTARKLKRRQSRSPGPSRRRTRRSELGPYAHEKQMPASLRKMLEEGAQVTRINKIQADGTLRRIEVVANETSRVIPVLRQLCEQDTSVEQAFLCSPAVQHVFKMKDEGGFCGYRNIQMLISYIKNSQTEGHEHFPDRIPSVLVLQDMIEQAWDMGINEIGRVDTGGIRGTRKYIGTSEAQALFSSLTIPCEPGVFNTVEGVPAYESLLTAVADYFQRGCSDKDEEKVRQTDLPPIYLQHEGHSLTIVGLETRKSGSSNLLVFDPMFRTPPAIEKLIDTRVETSNPSRLIKIFRRCAGYLQKYNEFEILKLLPPGQGNVPSA